MLGIQNGAGGVCSLVDHTESRVEFDNFVQRLECDETVHSGAAVKLKDSNSASEASKLKLSPLDQNPRNHNSNLKYFVCVFGVVRQAYRLSRVLLNSRLTSIRLAGQCF